MTRFSFTKLDNGDWGIKASGDLDGTTGFAGQTVTVSKKDGSTKQVKLGHRVTSWNGGRASVYTIAGAPRRMSLGHDLRRSRPPFQGNVWARIGESNNRVAREYER